MADRIEPRGTAGPDAWWQPGVIYQIYPRSFQDSDGDGIGDLRGIIARLDHVAHLGVDAIWLSPVYPSPMKDAGYDVADYTGIDPLFGTLDDFEALVGAAHDRGLRVLMDFVPSHSSDRHPWFEAARQSRNSAKRDWYVWRDPGPDGGPPTNWISEFAGPTWTWDEATAQYYLHIFLPEQPALNWRNPEVRAAMYDAMRVWFDRGVDGFRVDAFENLAPDPDRGDNPPNPDWDPASGPARSHLGHHSKHQALGYDVARDMRAVAREYDPERLLVGEIYGSVEELMGYYGDDLDAFQLPFNFQLIETPWDPRRVAEAITHYEAALPEGAWPNWVLGNHDRARIATRAGAAQARVAAMLLLTLRGTPTLYQGDEFGMENVAVPPHLVQDPREKNVPGHGLGRDPVRVPIAWEADAPNAGFTTGTPWLPMANRPDWIAERQAADPGSLLSLHRDLIALRRGHAALATGAISDVRADGEVLRYLRSGADEAFEIALNFSDAPRPFDGAGTCVLSSRAGGCGVADRLEGDEGRILRLP